MHYTSFISKQTISITWYCYWYWYTRKLFDISKKGCGGTAFRPFTPKNPITPNLMRFEASLNRFQRWPPLNHFCIENEKHLCSYTFTILTTYEALSAHRLLETLWKFLNKPIINGPLAHQMTSSSTTHKQAHRQWRCDSSAQLFWASLSKSKFAKPIVVKQIWRKI